ncbi:MAG: helix-turn-helix domain-containing protein [Oscillospiraceae bacterium]|nr:helix-turn-helix domain-containing protein [Oscillospiraceae bacterium]
MLVRALTAANDEDTCARLLEDLCTIHEVKSLAQRIEVARLLRKGVTYQEIAQRTGASTATISRVNRSLLYGAQGYPRVLDALEEQPTRDGSKEG